MILFEIQILSKILDIVSFGFIYFFVGVFCLPTLPLTIISGQLYELIPASFAITLPVTLIIMTQMLFPRTFGFGISSDQYIEKLAKRLLKLICVLSHQILMSNGPKLWFRE